MKNAVIICTLAVVFIGLGKHFFERLKKYKALQQLEDMRRAREAAAKLLAIQQSILVNKLRMATGRLPTSNFPCCLICGASLETEPHIYGIHKYREQSANN